MHEQLIQLVATATRVTCRQIAGPGQAALQASLNRACAAPDGLHWERKAAAHAEFFNALAAAAASPRLARVLGHGAGLAYDLMVTAGPAADGIAINSRRRMLARLRAGDGDGAALEMEKHLRTLCLMGRLATPSGRRAPANEAAVR